MRRFRPPSVDGKCIECSDLIVGRRSDASFCSDTCRSTDEKRRYVARNTEYRARQRKLSQEITHRKVHGHTRFIDNPQLNPKDKYRVARSLGYRSMLEVAIARQLEANGINPRACYEAIKIPYVTPAVTFIELRRA